MDRPIQSIQMGARVKMRKPHPCGGDVWEVYRIGADIGLRCLTCDRRVMLARSDFNKRLKQVIEPAPTRDLKGDNRG